MDDFLIRKGDASRIQSLLLQRDHGICALCGADMAKLKRVLRHVKDSGGWPALNLLHSLLRIPRHRKHLWDGDHVVPVVEGGGGCGLDNYRTLCLWCHLGQTAALAIRRAQARRDAKRPLMTAFGLEE